MSDETPANPDLVPFQLTYSVDRKGFFRRTCPSCGRDFKTKVNEADFVSSLQPAFVRLEAEVGVSLAMVAQSEAKEFLYCPYCQHYAESSDMLTETFVAYFKRLVMREVVLPMLHKTMQDAFGKPNRSRSRGLISFDIAFTHERSILPPRPIIGPEPPDMTIVELLCCNKKVKLYDGWMGLERCPYCGTQITLQ